MLISLFSLSCVHVSGLVIWTCPIDYSFNVMPTQPHQAGWSSPTSPINDIATADGFNLDETTTLLEAIDRGMPPLCYHHTIGCTETKPNQLSQNSLSRTPAERKSVSKKSRMQRIASSAWFVSVWHAMNAHDPSIELLIYWMCVYPLNVAFVHSIRNCLYLCRYVTHFPPFPYSINPVHQHQTCVHSGGSVAAFMGGSVLEIMYVPSTVIMVSWSTTRWLMTVVFIYQARYWLYAHCYPTCIH